MGVLDIICLTTDPDSTTFYGFAYAYGYVCNDPYDCTYNVLVKSNANPTSGSTITWSLVSKIIDTNMPGNPYFYYDSKFSCAINAQGVFTMLGWTHDRQAYIDKTFGIRYDPTGTMDAKYNFQGPGAWMNITIDQSYNWTKTAALHK